MKGLKRTRHALYYLRAYILFPTKEKQRILEQDHISFIEENCKRIAKNFDAEILEFKGDENYVSMLIDYPPRVAISTLVNSLKGVSSRMLKKHYPSIGAKGVWDRSYIALSEGVESWRVLEEFIQNLSLMDTSKDDV